MKKIVFLTVLTLMIFSLCPHAYSQHKLSRPIKSNSNNTATKQVKVWGPKTQISDPDGYINGHGYVDLGLPSGLKWAVCNVGASSPQEYGNYYAWGETSTKKEYTKENSLIYEKDLKQSGIIDNSGELTTMYDVARTNWGGSWHIPTHRDFQELVERCQWEKTSINGKNGYKIIGPNNKSIFLSAAGMRFDARYENVGTGGLYLSSTPGLFENSIYYLCLYDDYSYGTGCYSHNYNGHSVRPVTE